LFTDYKNKLGYYIFKKKMFKVFDEPNSFKDFIEKSMDYLIILPLNDLDFSNSFDVAKYFRIHKKDVTLFLPEHKVNSIDIMNNYKYISFNFEDISKIGLPTKQFIEKLNEYSFDVIIDLERENNLFLSAIICSINAKFKVGFKKSEIDNLYNLQIVNTKINSEISYRNLLNSLKMF